MIGVSEDVRKDIQTDMFASLINADTQVVDNKHSGKFITNLTNDVGMITNLVSTAILNLFKDSFNFNCALICNGLSKLEVVSNSNYHDPPSKYRCKKFR